MAKFTQIVNRESQLQTVLDGYENAIQKPDWLAEAVQKDGIQNSWDAKVSKRGENWKTSIYYIEETTFNPPVVIIEDSGTKGLTGEIPQNKEDLVRILKKEDPRERLSYFLSSDWSKKDTGAIGSRGRGKMIFVGTSKNSLMYFDSLRPVDNKYIFGKTYLDENKEIQIEIFEGKVAVEQRNNIFGNSVEELFNPGTRIYIPYPKQEVVDVLIGENFESIIQNTWWEILSKYNAKILIGQKGNLKEVKSSSWLPIEKSGIKTSETYNEIIVDSDLKIKRLCLGLLDDKDVPDDYHGIAIQRGGMTVERRAVNRYLPELLPESLYGSVEFDIGLEQEMSKLESPEHYSFTWYKGCATGVNKVIRGKIKEFAIKNKLIRDENQTSKEQREAEIEAQKDLNNVAKTLGITGNSWTNGNKKKKKKPSTEEPIVLSMADFETPYENGRVNSGEQVTGTYCIPSSIFDTLMKVQVRIWVYRDGGDAAQGLFIENEISLSSKTVETKVGWENIKIDERFTKGKYILKAKIISLEDKRISEEKSIEKGEILYREVARSFWVDEDPPEHGFFEIRMKESDQKNKYIWWEEGIDSCFLYWNGKHPSLKSGAEDKLLLKEILKKEGIYFLLTLLISHTISSGENKNKLQKEIIEIANEPFERQFNWIMDKRSECLWEN